MFVFLFDKLKFIYYLSVTPKALMLIITLWLLVPLCVYVEVRGMDDRKGQSIEEGDKRDV